MVGTNSRDEFTRAVEIIPDTLYFCSVRREELLISHSAIANAHIAFTTDRTLVYEPFYADFGPLSLGQTYRFCKAMEKVLDQAGGDAVSTSKIATEKTTGIANDNLDKLSITTEMNTKDNFRKKVYYYCGHDPHKRANSAVLVSTI